MHLKLNDGTGQREPKESHISRCVWRSSFCYRGSREDLCLLCLTEKCYWDTWLGSWVDMRERRHKIRSKSPGNCKMAASPLRCIWIAGKQHSMYLTQWGQWGAVSSALHNKAQYYMPAHSGRRQRERATWNDKMIVIVYVLVSDAQISYTWDRLRFITASIIHEAF